MYHDNDFINSPAIHALNKTIKKTKGPSETIEGNCLYRNLYVSKQNDNNLVLNTEKKNLRHNLYLLGKHSKVILEIGFNGGHSCALFLYANKNAKIYAFDICDHLYTEPCHYILSDMYNIDLIKGDSRITLNKFNTDQNIDLIHIDGGHGVSCATSDLNNACRLANQSTLIVLDDTNNKKINNLANEFINKNMIKEIDYRKYKIKEIEQHRIFQIV